jgi:hypothetical protein
MAGFRAHVSDHIIGGGYTADRLVIDRRDASGFNGAAPPPQLLRHQSKRVKQGQR